MPPSPVVMILRGWNDHAARSAHRADRRAVDTSSRRRTRRPRRSAMPARVAQARRASDVGRHAALVHHDHRPGAGGEHGVDASRRVRLPRREVDVGEYRRRADVADRVRGGDERERRDDDLVARPDAEHDQRQVQRRWCSDDTATPCRRPTVAANGRFELGDPWTLGDPARRDRLGGRSASSAPSQGSSPGSIAASPQVAAGRLGARPATTRPAGRRPSSRSTSASKPSSSRAGVGVGQPPGDRVDRAVRVRAPARDPNPSPQQRRPRARSQARLDARWRRCRPRRSTSDSPRACWRGRCPQCRRSPSSAGRRRGSAAARPRRCAPSSAPAPRCRRRGRPCAGRTR